MLLILGDQDVGEGLAGPLGGDLGTDCAWAPADGDRGDEVAVGFGGLQRGGGQRLVWVHPGREQARAVQGALDRGGGVVRDAGGEPDELPERGTGARVTAGWAQVSRRGRVVPLGGDGVALFPEVRQAPAGLGEGGVQAGPGGDRRGLPVGDTAVVDLRQAGRAWLADPVKRRREGGGVVAGDDARVAGWQ